LRKENQLYPVGRGGTERGKGCVNWTPGLQVKLISVQYRGVNVSGASFGGIEREKISEKQVAWEKEKYCRDK